MTRRCALSVLWALATIGCEAAPPVWDAIAIDVADSPASALACTVSWSTDAPATSRVEFGEGDELTFFLQRDEWVTDHEVTVYGLHRLSSYRLEVVSTDEDGVEHRSEPVYYGTSDLPFTAATFELTELREDRVQPGWTLTNQVVDGLMSPTVAMALDMEGRIVWYHAMEDVPAFADVEVTLVDGDRLLIGGDLAPGVRPVEVSWAGDVLWEGSAQPEEYLASGATHHTFRKTDDGQYLTLTFGEHDGVVTDVIELLNADGSRAWSWNTIDHVEGATEEHIHGNMALLDDEHGWFNSLLANALFKFDRDDGHVIWALGEGRDFEMLTEHEWPWADHSHAPEIQPDGSILVYDNGIYPDRAFSRAVQYELDEEAMTASIVWEYPGELADDPWFTSFWGDADRLANGNTLITAGTVLEFDTQSTLFEVTADGEKVWQVMVSSPTEDSLAGCYAAERVDIPLGVL